MKWVAAWCALALLSLPVICACQRQSGWEGNYSGRTSEPAAGPLVLHLQSDGKGLWEIDGESTPFRWEERQGALWLHLKSGGVILARPMEPQGTLDMVLPGVGSLRLKKSG